MFSDLLLLLLLLLLLSLHMLFVSLSLSLSLSHKRPWRMVATWFFHGGAFALHGVQFHSGLEHGRCKKNIKGHLVVLGAFCQNLLEERR